jgi:hypothetical protein
MDRVGNGKVAFYRVLPRASKLFSDRAALYLELQRRRRRAVLLARHALAAAEPAATMPETSGQARSNGSFHCAVRSSMAADVAIGSTGASAA